MRKLFLCSQFHHVSENLGEKLSQETHKPMVFIDTCLHDKVYKDSELEWHFRNKKEFSRIGFKYDIYNIAGKTQQEIQDDLSQYEIMYIEGGNTPYLLQQARLNNFEDFISQRISEGLIYISTSAGSVIAGPDISANSRPGKTPQDYGLTNTSGFSLVNFVVMPHWGAPSKKEAYMQYKCPQSYNLDFPYILLTDNQYVEVRDDWYRIVDVTMESQSIGSNR